MEKKEGGRRGSSVFIQIVFIALVFFLILTASQLLLLRKYYAVEVYGTSMEGTVQSGDIVYAEREFTLKRGEIVIVDVSQNPTFSSGGEHFIIKRLIAVAGDRVKCENGTVYLAAAGGEYEPLNEPYISGTNEISFEYTLAEGEVFVMGDNRTVSLDSRIVGPLSESDVIGVVPEWSVELRHFIAGWENIRYYLTGWMQK